jgi:hypothetical protein
MDRSLKRCSSPTPGSPAGQPGWGGTVREGVIGIVRRPPSRSGYCTALAVLVVLSVALILAACNQSTRRNGMPVGAQAALDAAIEDIDAGRYEKLYNEAADEWRQAATLDQSKATFKTLHDKLGNVRNRELQTAREEQTSTGPISGHSLVVIYQTTFEQTRGTPSQPVKGMETFTLLERGGRWYLARYFVTSNELK